MFLKHKFKRLAGSLTAILVSLVPFVPSVARATVPATPFSAEYFSNRFLSGSPALTRSDAEINFSWAGGSPDPSMPVDDFSARWTTTEFFEAGTWNFAMTSDDGAKLFIDGTLVINDYIGHAVRTVTSPVVLTEGMHTIKMEYYEDHGGAYAKLNWTKAAPTAETDYSAKFWNFNPVSVPAIPLSPPNYSTSFTDINFVWNAGSPNPAINNDYFVGQFKAVKNFAPGLYQFEALSDDGVRVFIDNVPVIDEWSDHASATFVGYKNLAAGFHNIRVEYFERGGGAVLKFNYKKLNFPPSTYTQNCWNNRDLAGSPVYSNSTTSINFNWGNGSPNPAVNNDNFSCRFTKTQFYDEMDTHTFNITSDDGTRLYIDGVLVLNDWMDHPAITRTVTKTLPAGDHEIKLEYYERGGGALVTLVEH